MKQSPHQTSKNKSSLFFSNFSQKSAKIVGNPFAFIVSFLFIIAWLVTGPIFHYSDTWQLIVNTTTSVVTFLMVFLIQHTQNRDTEILNIKIDELIKGQKDSKNEMMDLSNLSQEELEQLEKAYKKICKKN